MVDLSWLVYEKNTQHKPDLLGQGWELQWRVCKYSRRFILIMRIWRPPPQVLVQDVNPVSNNRATINKEMIKYTTEAKIFRTNMPADQYTSGMQDLLNFFLVRYFSLFDMYMKLLVG
jgi:hypothetical protein